MEVWGNIVRHKLLCQPGLESHRGVALYPEPQITMSGNSFHELYYHIVWATKGRMPSIDNASICLVREVGPEEATKRGAQVIACGVMPDHVHILVRLTPTDCIATFVGQVKGGSARRIHSTLAQVTLSWQEGYGALTLRSSDLERVARYVNSQPAIHARRLKHIVLELHSIPVHGDSPTQAGP